MNDDQRYQLEWLGNHYAEERRTLRTAEDSLFNWAASVFLAGLGTLTGFRGFADRSWGLGWRLIAMFGIAATMGVILFMAFLLRRKYEGVHGALMSLMSRQGTAIPPELMLTDDRTYFYIRWGGVGLLGLIVVVLIWMLG
jgi:hypothetical protein